MTPIPRSIPELVAELRTAQVALRDASARHLREFDLFGFRHDVTEARTALLERVRALDDEILELLAPTRVEDPVLHAALRTAGDQVPDWVIWSYEHDAWWAPHERGYVKDLAYAGRYPEGRALEIEADANVHRPVDQPNERAMPLAFARTAFLATKAER